MPQKLAAKTRRKNSVKHATNKRRRNRSFRRQKRVSRARRVVRKFGGTVYKDQDITFRARVVMKEGKFEKKSSGRFNTGWVKRYYRLYGDHKQAGTGAPAPAELLWTRDITNKDKWASVPLMKAEFTQTDEGFTITHDGVIHEFRSNDATLKSMLNTIIDGFIQRNAALQAQKDGPSDDSKFSDRLERVAGMTKKDVQSLTPVRSTDKVMQHSADTTTDFLRNRDSAGSKKYYNGVYPFKEEWVARVRDNNHTEQLIGTYKTQEEAARAYDNYAKEHALNVPLNFRSDDSYLNTRFRVSDIE